VNVLMSIELILNSANINLVAFSRFAAGNLGGRSSRLRHRGGGGGGGGRPRDRPHLYRLRRTPNLDEADILKG